MYCNISLFSKQNVTCTCYIVYSALLNVCFIHITAFKVINQKVSLVISKLKGYIAFGPSFLACARHMFVPSVTFEL